jgi:hypothetical protein
MDLVDLIKNDKNDGELFSDVCILAWYDDITSGIIKFNQTADFYFVNTCYFDPDKRERILTLIPVTKEWVQTLKDMIRTNEVGVRTNDRDIRIEIESIFKRHDGPAYLMRTDSLVSGKLREVVEIPSNDMVYFHHLEDTFEQEDSSKQKWREYF